MLLSRISAAALAAVAILFVAFGGPAAAQDLPGFGDSTAMPTGAPFKLPEGLELTIVSHNSFDLENTCKRPNALADEEPKAESGLNGGLVRVCFQFSNKTREPINVELPPGLIVISSSRETQHGMLFQKLNLEVPAEQDLYAPIKADCMNVSRSAPGVGVPYELGPATDSKDIREAPLPGQAAE